MAYLIEKTDKEFTKDGKILVRYKFKNSKKENLNWMTSAQYENLKDVELIEYCEIVE